MATNTRIEWADATINPLVGCSKISPACNHCYAERMAARMVHNPAVAHRYAGTVDAHGKWTGKINVIPGELLGKAQRMRRTRRIFVGSMSDLFHPRVADGSIATIFSEMACVERHTYMLLTKRPDRMRELLSCMGMRETVRGHVRYKRERLGLPQQDFRWPLPNVWLGTTVEDQARADERVPELLATPGALHFVSCEPLLGPVDLSPWLQEILHEDEVGVENGNQTLPMELGMPCMHDPWIFGLRWVIAGGETGPGARPSHPDWFRSLRDQCKAHGVPFFFKSWGEWCPRARHPIQNGLSASDLDPSCTRWPCVRLTEAGGNGWRAEDTDGGEDIYMQRVGKASSGRLLDGMEHNAIPAGRG